MPITLQIIGQSEQNIHRIARANPVDFGLGFILLTVLVARLCFVRDANV